MREYKREKATVESQLNEMESRSRYHDDHLRTIDIWFDQVCLHRCWGRDNHADRISWSTR